MPQKPRSHILPCALFLLGLALLSGSAKADFRYLEDTLPTISTPRIGNSNRAGNDYRAPSGGAYTYPSLPYAQPTVPSYVPQAYTNSFAPPQAQTTPNNLFGAPPQLQADYIPESIRGIKRKPQIERRYDEMMSYAADMAGAKRYAEESKGPYPRHSMVSARDRKEAGLTE